MELKIQEGAFTMKKLFTTSLAGLVVLGGCAFGNDDSSKTSVSQKDDDQKEQTQQEENKSDNQSENKGSSEEDNADKNKNNDDSGMSDDSNDSTNKDESTDKNTEESNNENNGSEKQDKNTKAKHPMNKDRAKTELEEYEEAFLKVINYTKKDGELKEYKTKDKLKEHFMHFMAANQADELINTYFEMKDGALHVKAMDGPKFLLSDKPFTFKEGSNGSYKVVQERDNELTGHIKTTFTLTVNDGGYWIIQDVNTESLE